MVFLPIVERELRVAARKPSTFWVRLAGVLVALVLGVGFLLLSTFAGGGVASPSFGRALFAVLTWIGLAAALSFGLFFTSDCLSQERRDGTLGFLFLTDLKGYDVVLGKLLATSLRGFCVLLGVFPILAITLMMGGVTGSQFWKSCLALASALLMSLAAGMLVSVFSRHSQRAMAGTLFLLGLLAAGGPAGDGLIAVLRARPFEPLLSLSSPVILFLAANQWGGGSPFWMALWTNQAVLWVLLGFSFWRLPGTWQDQPGRELVVARRRRQLAWFGSATRREGVQSRLMDLNPALWLLSRERWQAAWVWGLSLLTLAGMSALLLLTDEPIWWYVWAYFSGGVSLLLYLGFASQSGKFFLESKQNGFLELLLATPLQPVQLVNGQWRGLLRLFALPVGIILGVHLVGGMMAQYHTWQQMAGATAAMPAPTQQAPNPGTTGTNFSSGTNGWTATTSATPAMPGLQAPHLLLIVAAGVAGTLVTAANFVALIWFGMWMGLTSKTVNLATLKTILFVQVIPWFAISMASGLITALLFVPMMLRSAGAGGTGGAPNLSFMAWYPLLAAIIVAVLGLAKNAGFVMFARRRLFSRFRERAHPTFGPTPSPLPPVLESASSNP